jgi:hypothetical protein
MTVMMNKYSFIPLACAECDDSLPFSAASAIRLCYVLVLATLLHQLFFHPLSLHLAIYFLVYLSILLFPKYIYNTLLGIIFSSILCTCPNERNLFNLINTEFLRLYEAANYSTSVKVSICLSCSAAAKIHSWPEVPDGLQLCQADL